MFSNEMKPRNPRATDGGTQFSAVPEQLLEKLRPIAFVETCWFLTIQLLEFQEIILAKKYLRNHLADLSRKIWILTWGIFNTTENNLRWIMEIGYVKIY